MVRRQAHILEIAGPTPSTAILVVLMLVALTGCGVSLRMLAVDDVYRRVERVEAKAKALDVMTTAPEAEPGEPEVFPKTVDVEAINKLVKSILYECQEILGWARALVKDVGGVPPKKKLKLDTPEERDVQFEYAVKSGAKASARARKKGHWDNWVGKVIKWTVSAVWSLFPWWIRYPGLAVLTVWLGSPLYINYQRARAARAAAQGEAAVARMRRHVNDEQFAEAVDAGHNLDLARVHEKQKKREVKAAQKKAARKVREGER